MYNLYAWVNCWTGIDVSDKEQDIASTMLDYYQTYGLHEFMVVDRTKDRDNIYLRTRTEEQLLNYLDPFINIKKVKTLKK